MMKIKIRIEGLTKTMCLFATLLLTCSCGEELSMPETANEEGGIPLQLSVSLDNAGFSSDSEIIPMSTRAERKPYVVTRLLFSTLYILKEVGEKQWVVMEKIEKPIEIPSNQVLKQGESPKLQKSDYVLLPGKYRFLLFVNAEIAEDIPLKEILNDDCKGTSTVTPRSNFYFAEDEIVLEKTDKLDQNSKTMVCLKLKRHSALLRYIMVGDRNSWDIFDNPTIDFSIKGTSVCTGMNILGENKIGDLSINNKVDIKMEKLYNMAGEQWAFSSINANNTLVSLYADDKKREIDIEITQIGNSKDTLSFKGSYHISNVPIQRNRITTILIRRKGTNNITHELNPKAEAWDTSYPPLDYIELNNVD